MSALLGGLDHRRLVYVVRIYRPDGQVREPDITFFRLLPAASHLANAIRAGNHGTITATPGQEAT